MGSEVVGTNYTVCFSQLKNATLRPLHDCQNSWAGSKMQGKNCFSSQIAPTGLCK